MKTRILLIVMMGVMGLSSNVNAQTPTWQWARQSNSTISYNNGGADFNSMTSDDSGNVYLSGRFGGCNLYFGNDTLRSWLGDENMYITKYNSSGDFIYAKCASDSANLYGYQMATDNFGDLYVIGRYSESMRFAPYTLPNISNQAMFIVKYDPVGNVIWVKGIGANHYTDQVAGYGITTDASGNMYTTGILSGSVTFGTQTIYNTGGVDMFLAKFNSMGNSIWAKGVHGTTTNTGIFSNELATDIFGNLFVTGHFIGQTLYFDLDTLHNSGDHDFFLAKYDSSGNELWARGAGGTLQDYGNCVTTDTHGNIYATGFFYSPSITFGTITLTNSNSGNPDVFIVKYDSTGNLLWAKNGIGISAGYGIVTDDSNNVYIGISGSSAAMVFDTLTIHAPTGSPDPMYVVKYNPSGNAVFGFCLKSGGDDECGIAKGPLGSLYVGGDCMANSLIFGPDTLVRIWGAEIPFVAKLGFNNLETNTKDIKSQQTNFLFPNPFTTSTTLTLQGSYHSPTLFIYNLMGQEVINLPVGTNKQITIPRNNLPAGMYFYKLVEENKEVLGVGKMIISD